MLLVMWSPPLCGGGLFQRFGKHAPIAEDKAIAVRFNPFRLTFVKDATPFLSRSFENAHRYLLKTPLQRVSYANDPFSAAIFFTSQ